MSKWGSLFAALLGQAGDDDFFQELQREDEIDRLWRGVERSVARRGRKGVEETAEQHAIKMLLMFMRDHLRWHRRLTLTVMTIGSSLLIAALVFAVLLYVDPPEKEVQLIPVPAPVTQPLE